MSVEFSPSVNASKKPLVFNHTTTYVLSLDDISSSCVPPHSCDSDGGVTIDDSGSAILAVDTVIRHESISAVIFIFIISDDDAVTVGGKYHFVWEPLLA